VNKIIQHLQQLNLEQSQAFSSDEARKTRAHYRVDHPTEFSATECMDGRVEIQVATGVPVGIIQPYRTLGGMFDIGSPYFGDVINDWVDYSNSRGRDCVMFVTYHFSKTAKHLGCKGFNYETADASAYMGTLRREVEQSFVLKKKPLHAIKVGIETDEGALVLHGDDGVVLNMADALLFSRGDLLSRVRQLYPRMNHQMLIDLVELLVGNQQHIQAIRAENRQPSELDHDESALLFGRGFHWLHKPNLALNVGPFDKDLTRPVVVAAGILAKNLQNRRSFSKEDGVVLMTSAVSMGDEAKDVPLREKKSIYLAKIAYEAIMKEVPELRDCLHVVAGVMNHETRMYTMIDPTRLEFVKAPSMSHFVTV